MNSLHATAFGLALTCAALAPAATAQSTPATPAPSSSGYVDGAMFRAMVDENREIVEVNLDGAILQALAKHAKGKTGASDADDSNDLFGKLKSIHAVIGTVKGPAAEAMKLVQQTDQKLVGMGWQRVTRIKDETSTVSVLTHTVGDRVDGLVALIFDSEDKELVFANLAGEIDVTRLGEIGERLNVPGLDQVPGAR
jgi:hypothetical protein